jgi:hypothetical protein
MASSGMFRRVAHVRMHVSVERSVSFIRVPRIGELGTLAVTSNRRTLCRLLVTAKVSSSLTLVTMMKKALSSSENVASYKTHRM